MDDLQIAWRPLGELIPYARNPRTHSDAQVAQIAASIREFGWTNPVLVDGENGIIAGHGRVLAARKLGLERVPVIELGQMSEAQKRAYVLADNQLALTAGWDEALLRLELADLSELGFDLGLIGFGAGELERLLAGEGRTGLTEDDEAPVLPEQAITRPGDLWVLGEHRCSPRAPASDVWDVCPGHIREGRRERCGERGFVERLGRPKRHRAGPCASLLVALMANGFSGTSDIDALAASMLMSLARHVDFAAACLAAPYDNVPDAGHVT